MSLSVTLASQLMGLSGISNAEFGIMSAQNRMLSNATQSASNPNLSFAGLKETHDRENSLMAKMLTLGFLRKALIAQDPSLEEMKKDDIKQSFSIFA